MSIRFVLVLGTLIAALAACTVVEPGCVPGMSIGCVCSGGAPGTQVCQSNHTYAACSCGHNDGGDVVDATLPNDGTDTVLDAIDGEDGGGMDARPDVDGTIGDGGTTDTHSSVDVVMGDGFVIPVFNANPSPCGLAAPQTLPAGVTRLVDLGHVSSVTSMSVSGGHVVSADSSRWILWDVATRTNLAAGTCGTSGCVVLGAHSATFAIKTTTGIEVRRLSDSAATAMISTTATNVGIADSGGYVWAGSAAGLTVWNTSGTVVTSHSGDYSNAAMFGASSELRIANGPAGASVIEYLAIPSGARTLSPSFMGSFEAWFNDGTRFLSQLSSTTEWVYEASGTMTEVLTVPDHHSGMAGFLCRTCPIVGGWGNYFWLVESATLMTDVYAVGGSTTPLVSGWFATIAGQTDMYVPLYPTAGGGIVAYRLDTSPLVAMPLSFPSSDTTIAGRVMAADSAGHWAVGGLGGAVWDDTNAAGPDPRSLGCGAAGAVAAATNGAVAVATASSGVLLGSALAGSTHIDGVFGIPSDQVELAEDGSLVAFREAPPRHPVFVFSLADYGVRDVRNVGTRSADESWEIHLSGNGSRIALGTIAVNTMTSSWTGESDVADVGGAVVVSEPMALRYRPAPILSADGHQIAVGDTVLSMFGCPDPLPAMRLYADSVLSGAAVGVPLGWLDNGHLLIQRYAMGSSCSSLAFAGSQIVGPTGTVLSTPALPQVLHGVQVVSPTQILDRDDGTIRDVATGAVVWRSAVPSPQFSSLAGSYVVSLSGSSVVVESH